MHASTRKTITAQLLQTVLISESCTKCCHSPVSLSFLSSFQDIMLRSTRVFQNLRFNKVSSVASSAMVRRSFGSSSGGHGHGHGHAHHAPAGPYDAPHHDQQTEEAWLFGINPHEEYKYEGWEYIILPTYLIAFGLLFFNWERDGNSFKVNISHLLYSAAVVVFFEFAKCNSVIFFHYDRTGLRERLWHAERHEPTVKRLSLASGTASCL